MAGLSACSTIKSWFPDKERDYQYTAEIPELIVPEDMKYGGVERLSKSSPALDQGDVTDISTDDPVSAVDVHPDVALSQRESEPEETSSPETQQKPNSEPGTASSLQIDQAKMPATRLVGKALTRRQVEIVERNIDRGYYYVKFDPNAVEAKDESIWDELNFLFGDDPSQEQEYRITIRKVDEQMSEVTVQDSDGKTLSNGVANALLKLITDGINEDIHSDSPEQETPADAAKPEIPQDVERQE